MRDKAGKFRRCHLIWHPSNWEDGYVDSDGRFRVYRPDYPRAYKSGYMLRAHVVWWLHTGHPHPRELELHHIDHNRLNDAIENLKPLTRSEHRSHHFREISIIKCENCGHDFTQNTWRVLSRPTKFCSQSCYHAFPRSQSHKAAMRANHRNSRKTECKNGHQLAGDNLHITKSGARKCITCRRQQMQLWRLRHK
mgnify:CR=1 FL=1